MNLRQNARGKPCMVRLPGCSHDIDETVLAHKNGGGGGMKYHDIIGAWACCHCHTWLDGRYALSGSTRDERDATHDEAIIRTQNQLLEAANKHGVTLAEAIDEWSKGLEL